MLALSFGFNQRIIDPICTIFFAGLVFHSTIEVFRSSLSVLLEEVPPHIELSLLEADIQNVSGVSNTHSLHVWSGRYCATCPEPINDLL